MCPACLDGAHRDAAGQARAAAPGRLSAGLLPAGPRCRPYSSCSLLPSAGPDRQRWRHTPYFSKAAIDSQGPTEGSQQCRQRSPGHQLDTIVCCGAQVAAVQCVCSLWVALIGASGQRGPASPNQAPSTGVGYFWCSSQQCARTLDTSLPVNKACSGVVSCGAQACRGVEVRGA